MLVSLVFTCLNVKYANLKMSIYQSVTFNVNHYAHQCESNAGLVTTIFQLARKPKLSRFTSSSRVSGRYFAYTFSVTPVEA